MKENRSEILVFRLTPEEKARVHQRMADMGIRSTSSYIRKMVLNGYCIHLQLDELQDIASQLRRLNANLNQYTKRAHVSGNVYQEDVEDLVSRTESLQNAVNEVFRKLSNINA